MSIKSDRWIRRMAESTGMIEPFEPGQIRHDADGRKIVSFGTSSYGYDVRCADEFKIFTNINSSIVDPKAFDANSFVDVQADTCIIPPNSFALARTVEYFRIPRSVLTVCLGKSTYARCFSADTRVALVDGHSLSFEAMARAAEAGERFFGYGMDASGTVIVTELEAPRWIGQDALLEIELDNGRTIRATPDHEFVLRDGTLLRADGLRAGTSLMPLYRALRHGCEMTFQPLTGHLLATRALADGWHSRHGIREGGAQAPVRLSTHRAIGVGEGFDRAGHGAAVHRALSRLRRDDERYSRHRDARSERLRALPRDPGHAAPRAGPPRARVQRCAPGTDRSILHRLPGAVTAFRDLPADELVANHRVAAIRTVPGSHDVYCLSAPETGNFALEAGVFTSNCGLIVNVTPLEPEWEGHVTLEFSNTTPLPARIYANEGVAQMLFFESDEVCETSYKDRGGKYQGQRGVTLPRT